MGTVHFMRPQATRLRISGTAQTNARFRRLHVLREAVHPAALARLFAVNGGVEPALAQSGPFPLDPIGFGVAVKGSETRYHLVIGERETERRTGARIEWTIPFGVLRGDSRESHRSSLPRVRDRHVRFPLGDSPFPVFQRRGQFHLRRGRVDGPMFVREAYLLAGPTASGKSAIAATLAREMGARILSADSMLVYRGMDIGTAKPSQAEIDEFGMGGVNVVTPAEEFSSGAWLRAAADWASKVPAATPLVIVGGTGLYFSALLRGLDRRWEKPPPKYPVISIDRALVRERIRARLDAMFAAGLEEERRVLHDRYPVWSRTAALAIGYREGDDREKVFVRTCQLAKRQDTWFRHQATAQYVEPTAESVRTCWIEHGPWTVRFVSPVDANLF